MAGLHRAPLCACRAAFFRTAAGRSPVQSIMIMLPRPGRVCGLQEHGEVIKPLLYRHYRLEYPAPAAAVPAAGKKAAKTKAEKNKKKSPPKRKKAKSPPKKKKSPPKKKK